MWSFDRIVKWLVVAVVVALLIAILLPALSNNRPVRRTQCAINLKSIAQAAAMYAGQYNDRLHSSTTPFEGSWLCDVPKELVDPLVSLLPQANSKIDLHPMFYCPENRDQQVDRLWGLAGNYRVMGYTWMGERSADQTKMPDLAALAIEKPPVTYHGKFINTPNPSMTELATDWIISDKPDATATKWSGFTRDASSVVYSTSHTDRGTPKGGNVVYFDGSVQWKPFDAKKPGRSVAIQQGGGAGAPYFWLPR